MFGFAALAALSINSCKEKATVAGPAAQPIEKIHVTPGECGNTIIVKNNGLPTNWQTENHRLIVSTPGTPTSPFPGQTIPCHEPELYIDIREFSGLDEMADWLKENSQYICFDKTNQLIECEHRIDPNGELSEQIQEAKVYRLTVAEFTSRLSTLGINYNTETYNNYFNVQITSGTVEFTTMKAFDHLRGSFSIPFIKSILATHHLTHPEDDIIEFRRIYHNGYRKIIISVNNFHYNFSQVPSNDQNPERGCTPL